MFSHALERAVRSAGTVFQTSVFFKERRSFGVEQSAGGKELPPVADGIARNDAFIARRHIVMPLLRKIALKSFPVIHPGGSVQSRIAVFFFTVIKKFFKTIKQISRNIKNGFRSSAVGNMEYAQTYNSLRQRGGAYGGGYNTNRQTGGCSGCDICASLACMDCCCECMGGDLISCC